jgi:hypothetical protein
LRIRTRCRTSGRCLTACAGGKTTVRRASVSTSGDTFTIYLTANATASVKVAWFILG